MHPYAYLIGNLIFGLFWFVLFLLRKDLRREMLTMSLIGGSLFPLALIYLPDYWNPEYIVDGLVLGIEDFLFAFFIAGIGATIYETLFRKTHSLCACRKMNPKRLISIIIVAITTLLGLTFIFKLNSIYSSYVAFLVIFAYMVYFRRDLFWQAIISGFSVGLIMFVFYQIWIGIYPGIIEHWWKLQNISGILVFGTPLEEILWGFTWGLVGGVIYEFSMGISKISKK